MPREREAVVLARLNYVCADVAPGFPAGGSGLNRIFQRSTRGHLATSLASPTPGASKVFPA